MSAKPSKKSANKTPRPAPVAASSLAGATAAPLSSNASTTMPAPPEGQKAPVSWLDSTDPRKRLWGKIILAAVWIYVAALWLLALDQTFNWGIFGPKAAPIP